MDLETLRKKVWQSHLLTEAERQYWLTNMPRMSEEQLGKLDRILGEAEQIPWTDKTQAYVAMIGQATQFCEQKKQQLAAAQ